jgi:hypothetical protein
MKVKFLAWTGDCDVSNEMISVRTNEWHFEADGKAFKWSIHYEDYFDEEGDGKGDGYKVFDNISGELKHDTRSIGWGDSDCQEIMTPNFESKCWTVGNIHGLDFIQKVNEYFSNGDTGWGLFNFPEAGYGEDNVLGVGEFEIN